MEYRDNQVPGDAPRVTLEAIDAEIHSEHYFTADDGVVGAYKRNNDVYVGSIPTPCTAEALLLLTFCVLVLRNGYTVTGESACASPENFNAEYGREVARAKAIDKIWPLLGFRLRDQLAKRAAIGGEGK